MMNSLSDLSAAQMLAHQVVPDDPWGILIVLAIAVCVFIVVPLLGIRLIYKMFSGATRPAVSNHRSRKRYRQLSEHLQQMEISIDQPSIQFGTAYDLLRELMEAANADDREWLMSHVRQLRTAQSVLSQGEPSDCLQILAHVRSQL